MSRRVRSALAALVVTGGLGAWAARAQSDVPPSPTVEPAMTPATPAATTGSDEDGEPAAQAAPTAPAPVISVPAPAAGLDAAGRAAWLDARLGTLRRNAGELASARIGVAVMDPATGTFIAGLDADEPRRLASTTKLATAAAALAVQGGAARTTTALYAEDRAGVAPSREVVSGDLVLRAGGDPTFGRADLEQLVDELWRRGVRRVDGGLVIDATAFDDVHQPPHYDEKPDDAAFRAPIAAATLDDDAVSVIVTPGSAAGSAAGVEPSAGGAYVVLTNEALTTDTGRTALSVQVKVVPAAGAQPPRLELTVRGTIRTDAAPTRLRKRVDSPEHFLGETLRVLLAARGIRVAKARLAIRAVSPRARLVARHDSPPLAQVLHALGKYSNNFVAEMVLKGLAVGAAPATTAAALTTARAAWARLGMGPGAFRIDNGSGLYDASRVSPRQLAGLLVGAWRDFRIAPDFVSQLAQAGVDGTLAKRMLSGPANGWVRAKTGTLDDVIALAGYAGTPLGAPLVFVVIVDDLPKGRARAARAFCDDVAQAVAALAQTPASQTPAHGARSP